MIECFLLINKRLRFDELRFDELKSDEFEFDQFEFDALFILKTKMFEKNTRTKY
jgi:hypothetical protein